MGLIVISSLAVPIVNKALESGIKTRVGIKANFVSGACEWEWGAQMLTPRTQDGWSSSDIEKFLNSDVNYTYRAFDIQNLDAAIYARPPRVPRLGCHDVSVRTEPSCGSRRSAPGGERRGARVGARSSLRWPRAA